MSGSIEPPNLKTQWSLILPALADRPPCGYGIVTEVLHRSGGRMRLWPGMPYGSSKRMAEAGLIEEVEEPAGACEDNRG